MRSTIATLFLVMVSVHVRACKVTVSSDYNIHVYKNG